MTTQQQITAIREKCIEANPSIKDLKMNCMIYHPEYGIAIINDSRGTGNGSTQKHFTDRSHVFYDDCRDKDGRLFRNGSNKEWWEIIGRPIHLADVLLAIGQNIAVVGNGCFLEWGTHFFHGEKQGYWNQKNISWDLKNDDLTLQSEETISFLYTLLASE